MADNVSNLVRQVDGSIVVTGGQTVQAYGSTGVLMAAGKLTPATSAIGLTGENITLQLGLPEEGPAIQFTEEGIKMTFGPPGAGSSIVMNAAGITLQVGPVTKLQLEAGGITMEAPEVKLTGTGSVTTEAPQVKVTGAAEVAVSAPLIKLG